MPEWVTCPNCRGEVSMPDNIASSLRCPKCQQVVCMVDTETGAKWKARPPAASWMCPLGWVAAGFGVLGFVASAYVDWERTADVLSAVVAGVLNPLFFVGFPLGLYWLGAFRKSFAEATDCKIAVRGSVNSSQPKWKARPPELRKLRKLFSESNLERRQYLERRRYKSAGGKDL